MEQKQPQQQQVQLHASDADLKGFYSNMAQVTHTQEEFILDFFNILPPQGQLVSRIITSPGHFKRLIPDLQDKMRKYEERFGQVVAAEGPKDGIGFKI